jgi:hypothetical protein
MATALVAACGAAAGDVALDALRKCVAGIASAAFGINTLRAPLPAGADCCGARAGTATS